MHCLYEARAVVARGVPQTGAGEEYGVLYFRLDVAVLSHRAWLAVLGGEPRAGGLVKAFACGDVVPGCDARWVCSSEDEILHQVAEHARVAHGIAEPSSVLVDAVRAAISSVPG